MLKFDFPVFVYFLCVLLCDVISSKATGDWKIADATPKPFSLWR